jgi:uncharacterized membrane protein (DUF2068 family)
VKRAAGLEAIIVYKLLKAAFELIVAVLLVVWLVRGPEASAATVAQMMLDHAAGAWALRLATIIVLTGKAVNVKIAVAAAFGDAVLSAVEALALRAGRWWAPWLVVFATAALVPVEVWEIARKPRPVRIGILLLNLAILVYLLRVAMQKHRERLVAEERS